MKTYTKDEVDAWDEADPFGDNKDLYDGVTSDDITREYQERVINDLLNSVQEFLRFSSVRQLIKLIAEEL